tara:strand:+ start:3836 stop:4648 length:813 start_codon:yes stop_codon:yes gene_type:complete
MKSVLVTGSSGFIGKHLVEYLMRRGIEVSLYDTKIHTSVPTLTGVDAIIHLGANSNTRETNIPKIVEQNFLKSCLFFEAAKGLGIKFLYASSAAVYGDSKTFTEEEFCSPKNPYAMSKYMFDLWVDTQKYPYQGFRFFNVFGSGEEEEGKGDQASPFYKFTKQALKKEPIRIFRGSEMIFRDFVHVSDVCEILFQSLSSDFAGIVNVGTGKPISFSKIAHKIAKKHKSTIQTIPFPKDLKKGYQKFTCSDNSKFNSIFEGFEFKNPLEIS